MKMKATDVGGAVSIIAAGYIIGRDVQRNDFTTTDLFTVAALIALGFYLAVYLS